MRGSGWPSARSLGRGEVQVWRAWLGAWVGEPGMEEVLDEEERARAGRFRFARDRERFVAAHGILRRLLGGLIGIEARDVVMVAGAHGKPAVVGACAIGFNLSHSGDVALFAFADDEIGVDVEAVRDDLELEAMAASAFAPPELAAWRAAPDARAAFFATWTRKEAYLKARGVGLSVEPASIAVDDDAAWSVAALDVGDGYAGAIAMRSPARAVACFELQR